MRPESESDDSDRAVSGYRAVLDRHRRHGQTKERQLTEGPRRIRGIGLDFDLRRRAVLPAGRPRTRPRAGDDVLGVEGLPGVVALLVVKRGPNAGSRFQLDQDKAIGRTAPGERHLPRRRHGVPAPRRVPPGAGEGYDGAPTSALNGTYVNRQPVEAAPPSNGDEVQIGKFRLVFLSGDQAQGDTRS